MRNLSSLEQSVYSAVPINADWERHQIIGELRRVGKQVAVNNLERCLNALKEVGLLIEKQGRWRRAICKEREPSAPDPVVFLPSPITTLQTKEFPMTTVARNGTPELPAFKPARPLDALAALASDLRRMAGQLEEVALAIETELSTAENSTKKLTQLQELLRGLGS